MSKTFCLLLALTPGLITSQARAASLIGCSDEVRMRDNVQSELGHYSKVKRDLEAANAADAIEQQNFQPQSAKAKRTAGTLKASLGLNKEAVEILRQVIPALTQSVQGGEWAEELERALAGRIEAEPQISPSVALSVTVKNMSDRLSEDDREELASFAAKLKVLEDSSAEWLVQSRALLNEAGKSGFGMLSTLLSQAEGIYQAFAGLEAQLTSEAEAYTKDYNYFEGEIKAAQDRINANNATITNNQPRLNQLAAELPNRQSALSACSKRGWKDFDRMPK